MKIAFFGAYGSFDYYRIGGTESFSRRLATGLMSHACHTDFIVYGAPECKHLVSGEGIGLHYFLTLEEALHFLKEDYKVVLTLYLHPQDRLHYIVFRHRNRKKMFFHQVYFSWSDSGIKRRGAFLDARIYQFNGKLFCVSPRIYEYVRRWSNRSLLFLPPIPESYFLEPQQKGDHQQIRVTYIGRTEPAKGIEDVIALYKQLKGHPEVALEIHGFHYNHSNVSVSFHEWLSKEEQISYFYNPFEGYSPQVETNVQRILKDTDILLLPYRRLSSTIDMPVLLLEGMASECAVITRAMGDIPSIYGNSPFLLTALEPFASAADLILNSRPLLKGERNRLQERKKVLEFRSDQLTQKFMDAIS
jgi:glycosyltransferase involved in cell wall biosynthesis